MSTLPDKSRCSPDFIAANPHLWSHADGQPSSAPQDGTKGPEAGSEVTTGLTKPVSRFQRRQEIDTLHKPLLEDIRRRGWSCIHSRPDKASTIRAGWPDFTVLNAGKVACIEFKAAGGTLSPDQRECIAELEANRTPVLVTEDLGDAIRFLREKLE
jgi:VRR-NUC domain-containing protein